MNIQHKIPPPVNFLINLTPILIINSIFISLCPFTVTVYFTVLDGTNLFHGTWLYKFISFLISSKINYRKRTQSSRYASGHNNNYNNNLFHRFLAENKKLELTVINFSSFVVDWLVYHWPEHWQVTMNLVVVAAAYQ